MFVNSSKIIKVLNELAPESLAESWDNVGFLVGNRDTQVDRILVALEVTEQVVEEAIQDNIDLIVCHHPLIFKPLSRLTDDDPIGRIVRRLVKHNISVYAAHTNLDIAEGGTNDYISGLLGLERVSGLQQTGADLYSKLAVYVPETHLDSIREAMARAGAGQIGAYSDCSYTSEGTGAFRPLEGSNAYIGSVGEVEFVKEAKVEVVAENTRLTDIVEAMKRAHPYEEPAYDIWELKNTIRSHFLGRIGFPSESMTLEAYAAHVKDVLGLSHIRYIGDPNRRIGKVAVCTGAGSDLMKSASQNRCDVLVTGDVKYHEAQAALQMNLSVIDAGHFETEQIYVSEMASRLKRALELKSYEIAVVESKVEFSPFRTIQ